MRDQAGPQARPRARDRARRRSWFSTAPSTGGRWARWRRLRGSPATISSDPCPAGYVAVPRDDPGRRLRDAVGERTAAVMVEPIQGEAGVFPIDDEVLVAAREACDAAGALLVFDEIQSGMGRTGSLWAYQQLPVIPDLITVAKAVGGGLPVGACVTAPALGDVLERGDHGSTFAGAPIAAAAALAAIDVIDDPELLRRTRELGARFMRGLAELDPVAEVRGRGLMVGVTPGEPAPTPPRSPAAPSTTDW